MTDEIVEVARRLNDVGIDGVFVGGATLSLLVTDIATAPPRFTDDVDLVVSADTRYKYYKPSEILRSAGHFSTRRIHSDLSMEHWWYQR